MKNGKLALASLASLALAGGLGTASAQESAEPEISYEDTTEVQSDYESANEHQAVDGMAHSDKMTKGMEYSTADLSAMDPDELEGKTIYFNGEEVGDVDSIRVEKATKERVAIIGIEGVVGANAKEVAVPLNRLRLQASGDGLETNLSKNELQTLPDVDPLDDNYEDIDEGV